jgi:hypothetical protein
MNGQLYIGKPTSYVPLITTNVVSFYIILYTLGVNICHIFMFHTLDILKDFVSREPIELKHFLAGKCI